MPGLNSNQTALFCMGMTSVSVYKLAVNCVCVSCSLYVYFSVLIFVFSIVPDSF